MKLTLISTPDGEWEMLFIDNELHMNGHSIYTGHLLYELKKLLPIEIKEIEVKELTWEALEKYDYQFPHKLSSFDDEDFS